MKVNIIDGTFLRYMLLRCLNYGDERENILIKSNKLNI